MVTPTALEISSDRSALFSRCEIVLLQLFLLHSERLKTTLEQSGSTQHPCDHDLQGSTKGPWFRWNQGSDASRPTPDVLAVPSGGMYLDVCICRSSRQRGLPKSFPTNGYKVAVHGRVLAIHLFALLTNGYKVAVHGRVLAIRLFAEELETDTGQQDLLPGLSGMRLVCLAFPLRFAMPMSSSNTVVFFLFADAHDRGDTGGPPPSSAVIDHMSILSQAS